MKLKISDIDLMETLAIEESRESFWAYRQFLNGQKLKIGWWQREIARILQDFYEEMVSGERPAYIIQAPPQHGKSSQIVDFISWVAGKNPDLKKIYTSFSERLGVRANLRLQRIYDSNVFQKIFPNTKLNSKNTATISSQHLRNREIIEYVGRDGYFRNTTVEGSITGESLDFGIVDDPIKGRKAANSTTTRNSVWDWFTDDFFTRFSEVGAMLWILTRWHMDDPAGRLIKAEDYNVKIFKYPAIAIENERFRKVGEALFPEHKSLEFLQERKKVMSVSSWESLYQQNPTVTGGEIVKSSWWQFYKSHEKPKSFQKVLQSWDLTFDRDKEDDSKNDYVVGTTWGVTTVNGRLRAYLLDLIRRKADFNEQLKMFFELSKREPRAFKKYIEKAANGAALISVLQNKVQGIEAVKPLGGKIERLESVTPFIEGGQVFLPDPREEPWVQPFINEFSEFPNGKHDDQVDTTSQALYQIFGEYNETRNYNLMYG